MATMAWVRWMAKRHDITRDNGVSIAHRGLSIGEAVVSSVNDNRISEARSALADVGLESVRGK